MDEIRFVGTGETRRYPYLVCKNISIFHGCTVWIEKSVSDPRDRFFYPHRTPMKDTYNINLHEFLFASLDKVLVAPKTLK